jgi:uncharacterized protein (TIGR02391 family)
MYKHLHKFESFVRKAHRLTEADPRDFQRLHPFDQRDIHQFLPDIVKKLFDDGHYSQATFEAFKFVDKLIMKLSKLNKSGFEGMMQALCEGSPSIQLTPNKTISEKDEQKGYQFLFAGSMLSIRNPRGHEFSVKDTPDICLDHLSFASMLLRRLEQAGYRIEMI